MGRRLGRGSLRTFLGVLSWLVLGLWPFGYCWGCCGGFGRIGFLGCSQQAGSQSNTATVSNSNSDPAPPRAKSLYHTPALLLYQTPTLLQPPAPRQKPVSHSNTATVSNSNSAPAPPAPRKQPVSHPNTDTVSNSNSDPAPQPRNSNPPNQSFPK